MEELERKLLEAWAARPEREKAVVIAVAVLLAVWFSWAFVVKENLRSALAARKTLAAAEAEYNEAVRIHKDTEAFKKKNEELLAELKLTQAEEEEFNQMIKAQGQLEDVLAGLRSEAARSSLKLVSLEVKTTYTAAAAAPGKAETKAEAKADAKTAPKKEAAAFKRSIINLVVRGPYKQSVEYFLRCMDMHRVMSLTSLSIGKTAVSAGRGARVSKPDEAGTEDSPLETRFEMEVLFR